ncbi:response regulator [Paenibacillus cellulositrophicus]|uniref:response regulator n=1 Tax=Paenibacillus cellulositrophicus TaxID=562959 RepID=UPI003F7DB294
MKVIIVEDEPRVRKGLSEAVDWSRLGMQLVGTACNGEEGWELFQSERPDLVIADIRMPIMDGLEMTRRIFEQAPETKVMIISGHDEFEYAQRCVSLGVQNYLLKPVGRRELAAELEKIMGDWRSERHLREQASQYQRKLRAHLQQLRSVFLEEWLGGSGHRTVTELMESLSFLEIRLNPETVASVAIFELDGDKKPAYSVSDRRLLEFALHNLLEELLAGRGAAYQRGNGQTVVIYQDETDEDAEGFQAWVHVSKEHAGGLLRVGVTAAVGPQAVPLTELPMMFQEAQRILGLKLSLGSGLVLQECMIRPVHEQLAVLHESYESLLVHGVELNDSEEIRRVLEQHFSKWTESKEIPFAEEIFFQFTGLFTKLAHRLGKSIRDYLGAEDLKKWQQPELFRSMDEIKNWWIRRFNDLSDSYQGFRADRKTKIIQQVMQYVDEHMDENITRKDAAGHVFINSSYLSRLFKEVTGDSFSNYVLNRKMERAIHLLQVERVMVYEVADRLGYKDPSYFARVFKKHTGKSPSDFQ